MYGDRTGIDDITVTCGDYRLTVVSEMSAGSETPHMDSYFLNLLECFSSNDRNEKQDSFVIKREKPKERRTLFRRELDISVFPPSVVPGVYLQRIIPTHSSVSVSYRNTHKIYQQFYDATYLE